LNDIIYDLVGQNLLYASSGVVIERHSHFTKFVTSASLVRALHDSGTNGHDKVQVCAADNHLLIAIVYFK
jgi:hypothetical protein